MTKDKSPGPCEAYRATLVELASRPASDGMPHGHLDECSACREELDHLRGAWRALPDADPVRPSSGVGERLRARARAGSVRSAPDAVARSAPRWRRAVGTAAVVALAFLGARAAMAPGGGSPGAEGRAATRARIPVTPGVAMPSFAALDVFSGERVAVDDLHGEVVVLNVWATWCLPCESEMPSMERLYRDLGPRGLRVVALSIDQESTHLVRRWVEERGFTFTILHDRDGVFERSVESIGVPETFVIGRDGVVLTREVGPQRWDSPERAERLRQLLAEGA